MVELTARHAADRKYTVIETGMHRHSGPGTRLGTACYPFGQFPYISPSRNA